MQFFFFVITNRENSYNHWTGAAKKTKPETPFGSLEGMDGL